VWVRGLRLEDRGEEKTHTQKRRGGAPDVEQKTHSSENQMRKDGAPSVFFGFELAAFHDVANG
jgi:hypothetical protein